MNTDFTSELYDSFFTIEEMDAFIAELSVYSSVGSEWANLTDEAKEPYIYASVTYINGFTWKGTRHADIIVPNMAWPRTDLTYRTGENVDDTTTPKEVGLASACYIIQILNGLVMHISQQAAVKSKTVGSVSVTYSTSSVNPSDICIIHNIPGTWYDSAIGARRRMGGVALRRQL